MRPWILAPVVVLLLPALLPAQTGAPPASAEASRPRVIVLLVIDQLRGDYVDRFGRYFGDDGFARLTREGAHFVNAHYSHGTTATGPGHACIATGANPRIHGISANNDERQECTDDETAPLVGAEDSKRTERGASPRKLTAPSLGQAMKLASNGRSRVVSLGLKDRAVILLGGRTADRAVWWDHRSGRFITSRYYGSTLPAYAEQLNNEHYADRFFGKSWERALPEAAYAACAPDDDPAELDEFGLGRTFPHKVDGGATSPGRAYYSALWVTPFGDELVVELTRRALDHEKLGTGEACDVLCLAMSSFDMCGHHYGPDSQETLDMTVRTDRQLAELWKLFDEKIGRGRYIVAVTGDHGVTPIAARSRRFDIDSGAFDESAAVDRLNAAVRQALRVEDASVKAVAAIEVPWVHLNSKAIRDAKLAPELVQQICAAELRKMDGVGWVFLAAQLAGSQSVDTDPAYRMAWQAYHPQLAGEIYVGLRPYWHKSKSDQATSHGTFNSLDRHVPILLYGPGIRAGRYYREADPIDIARTLCAMLGVEPAPTMTGRVLDECLINTAAVKASR